MKKNFLKVAAALGLIMVGLVLGGCGESRSQFAGTYKSVEPFGGKDYIDLDLQENGKGTWVLAGKTVEFTWVVNTGMVIMCIQIYLYDRFFVLDRGGFILRDRKI